MKSLSSNIFLLLVTLAAINSCRRIDDPPDNKITTDFTECITTGEFLSFDIITLNAELFPKSGAETLDHLADLIDQTKADLIAFQEISSETEFNKLALMLDGYRAVFYPINNSDWNLAYLVGPDCSVDESETRILFEDDFSSFPRPPFEIHVTHIPSGISAIFINNHFKCCGGIDNQLRRKGASEKLYNYISTEYSTEPVVILGDLNDEVDDPANENVFQVFLDDPDNFRFTDMHIATGSPVWWSYPSYPSHIDHFIITSELYGFEDTTLVFKPDACFSNYSDVISDHRPVYLRLR